MASSSRERKRLKSKKKGKEDERVQVLKHYDTFYGQAPPGLIKEEEEHPEDCIPNLPENKEAREFLSKAPTKGLWMPLGKEVKVMKCMYVITFLTA
ncbi:retinitis pigmentosa 9 protein-like [Stegodyphus dumicola]|uniref:retinitis pigmentosa 9 protein-like n=1 Tax=Stegodyphus dumicola TaxID=202533 RepID=UPI0015B345D6|nr:retinitis pigmentosa 9 protein-like [Stegodyphus dumicola]